MERIQRVLSSKRFHSALGIAVSVALLAFVISTVDWPQVKAEFRRFQWWAILPVFSLLILHFLIRAYRWRFILPPNYQSPFSVLFDALMVGNLATFVLPLRAGEFIRPYFLSRFSAMPFATAFVSIVVERFFDLAAVLLVFAFTVRTLPGLPAWVEPGVMGLSILALGLLFFLVVSALFPELITRVLAYLFRSLPVRFRDIADKLLKDFLDGARSLRNPGRLAVVILLTIAVWGSCFLIFQASFFLFGENPAWEVSVTTGVLVALAVAAPSAPGFVGVYQTACLAAFALFGLRAELAFAYSVASHLAQYILFVAYGGWVLTNRGVGLMELRKQAH